MEKLHKALSEGSSIKGGRYILGEVLGIGGFGITYGAIDAETGQSVAVKEYMPSALAERNGKDVVPLSGSEEAFGDGYSRFNIEWQMLASLRNIKHIVRGMDFFRENSTSYIVMERLTGADVKSLLAETPPRDLLPFCEMIVRNIGAALIEVHNRGIIHLDISPANIFFQSDGSLRLIDFGSAIYMNDDSLDTIQLKHGYAPPELYKGNSPKGPWTDVYALAATFYTLVSGGFKVPPAEQRLKNDALEPLLNIMPGVPRQVSDSIQRALSLNADSRYRTILEFLKDFNNTSLPPSLSEQGREKPFAREPSPQGAGQGEKAAAVINKIGKRLAGIPQKIQAAMPAASFSSPSPRPPAPSITVSSLRFGKNKISLSPGLTYKIGRVSGSGFSDFVVSGDLRVSKVHLSLQFLEQQRAFYVTDLSSNGTFYLDGRRLSGRLAHTLYPGETVYLGSPDCTVTFMLD